MSFTDRNLQESQCVELAWSFVDLPSAERLAALLDALARSMPHEINATEMFDDGLKSRRPRYRDSAISAFVSSASCTQSLFITAYSRLNGEDNRLPRSSITVRRVSVTSAPLYVLAIGARGGDAALITTWIDMIAAQTDWIAGWGGVVPVSIELDYPAFRVSGLPIGAQFAPHEAAVANIRQAERAPETFHPVLSGQMLRSVFEENILTSDLHERIASQWEGPLPGTVTGLDETRLRWSIPEPTVRETMYERLRTANLVFGDRYFDPSTYEPQIEAFSIPFAE